MSLSDVRVLCGLYGDNGSVKCNLDGENGFGVEDDDDDYFNRGSGLRLDSNIE